MRLNAAMNQRTLGFVKKGIALALLAIALVAVYLGRLRSVRRSRPPRRATSSIGTMR